VFSNGLRGGCPWTGFLFEVIERAFGPDNAKRADPS
jgi:hypothetical protein